MIWVKFGQNKLLIYRRWQGLHVHSVLVKGRAMGLVYFMVHSIDFHWKCLLLLWPWQRSNLSGWCILDRNSINVSTCAIKFFQTQRWRFVPLSKFLMWKFSMILMTLKTMSGSNLRNEIKDLVIMHFGCKYKVSTFNGYWFMDIYPLVIWLYGYMDTGCNVMIFAD